LCLWRQGADLNPIDLVAMGVGSCLMIVMAKAAEAKGLDLTGTWADASYDLKDYKIASITVKIHSPFSPRTQTAGSWRRKAIAARCIWR